MSRRGLCVAAVVCLVVVPHAASGMVLRGDPNWIANPGCPAGWEETAIDERDWVPVQFPWIHIWPHDWPVDADARPFWGPNDSSPVCVRRLFSLDAVPERASLRIWVDDDYDLFVNGIFVGRSGDRTAEMPGESYDVRYLLRPGSNALAIRLYNTGGSMGALVSLDLPGVPDPQLSFVERMRGLRPWGELAGIVAFLLLCGLVVGKLGSQVAPRLRAREGAGLALVLLGFAGACHWILATHRVWVGLRAMPVVRWNLSWVFTAAALFAAAAVLGAGASLPERHDRKVSRWWAAALLLLALLLRTIYLDSIPTGFFQDEAINGIDAINLTHGGVQFWSGSIGGRGTLFLWVILASFQLLGVSYLTLKTAAVIFGVATVPAVYWLARETSGTRVACWAAFFLAVSRWHIHFSRIAWEAICLPFFAALGFALMLQGLRAERRSAVYLTAAGLTLSLGLYTYAAYRAIVVVAVLFGISLLAPTDRRRLRSHKSGVTLGALGAFAVAAPLLVFAWTQPDSYWWRYREVSLTHFITYFGSPLPWIHQIGRSLFSLHGVGDEMVRHNLPEAPHLDPIVGLLFLVGLAMAVWRWRELGARLMILWFVVFLLLASLTADGPHATRLLGLLVPAVVLAAEAFVWLLDRLHLGGRSAALFATMLLAMNAHQYFVIEAYHPHADEGYDLLGRQACEYVRRHPGVVLYRSDDVAFFTDTQCYFLTGDYFEPKVIHAQELRPKSVPIKADQETVVILGREFLAGHQDLQPDRLRSPKVNLPVAPLLYTDRSGVPLLYIYHFGPGVADQREPIG